MSLLNPEVLERIIEAAAERVADDVSAREVVSVVADRLADDVDTDEVIRVAAEKVADNADEDAIADEATDRIVGHLDEDAITESIVERVAEKLFNLLTHPDVVAREGEPVSQTVSACRAMGCQRVHPDGHPVCPECLALEPWHYGRCSLNPYTPRKQEVEG